MTHSTMVPSPRRLAIWGTVLALVGLAAPRLSRENFFSDGGVVGEASALPEFPVPRFASVESVWMGTEPMVVGDLQGRVWVLKVWAFGCVNCLRSIPYTNALSERFGEDLGVLGIHSPEYDWERDLEALAEALAQHDVRFPNYLDETLEYFFTLEAPAWPAFYVVDRKGRIRGRWVGEMHEGTLRAGALEALVTELIAE